MPKITKRVVDGLRPAPAGEVFAWDSELKGFGVRVMPSGVASYIVKYRTAEGRQRKLAFARVGTVTPDEARKVAAGKLSAAARGEDPSADRNRIRHAVTVSQLCDLYLEDAEGRLKLSTLKLYRSLVDCHVTPLVGARRLPAVTSDDIVQMRKDIEAGRTAKPRRGNGGVTTGGGAVAARTVGMLGATMEFAVRRKFITANPVRGVWRQPDGECDRYLRPEELSRLGRAMHEAVEAGETEAGIGALRFLMLTGLRRNEALALPWQWVDAPCFCIRFGDTKIGKQLRAIGSAAAGVLPARNGSKWVYPADRGEGHFIGIRKVVGRLCERAAVERFTPHVLRHTFATTAAEIGYSTLVIAGLLGHRVSGVTAKYAHMPDPALVAAAEVVSGRIAERLAGNELQTDMHDYREHQQIKQTTQVTY